MGELAKTCRDLKCRPRASHGQKLARTLAKTCLDLKCTALESSHDQQNAPKKGTDQDLPRSKMPAPEQGINCEKKKVAEVGKREGWPVNGDFEDFLYVSWRNITQARRSITGHWLDDVRPRASWGDRACHHGYGVTARRRHSLRCLAAAQSSWIQWVTVKCNCPGQMLALGEQYVKGQNLIDAKHALVSER